LNIGYDQVDRAAECAYDFEGRISAARFECFEGFPMKNHPYERSNGPIIIHDQASARHN
jgi:hypothetical protein